MKGTKSMEQKYIYSIFISSGRLCHAKNVIEEFIQSEDSNDIFIEGIDHCYLKSYINKDKTVSEICISSKTLKTFDDLWNSLFGRNVLQKHLGYTLHTVQRGIYGIYKRPNTYKIKSIEKRLPKIFFIPF